MKRQLRTGTAIALLWLILVGVGQFSLASAQSLPDSLQPQQAQTGDDCGKDRDDDCGVR